MQCWNVKLHHQVFSQLYLKRLQVNIYLISLGLPIVCYDQDGRGGLWHVLVWITLFVKATNTYHILITQEIT